MNQKVLIVDHDFAFSEQLSYRLKEANFDVFTVHNASDAKEAYINEYPCMILMELALPDLSGEELCEWIRAQNRQDVSIIVVSQKILVEDKIRALTLGADDYLTKPINYDELLAHMHAVLRRTGLFCQKIIHQGLCIKPRKGIVLLNGQEIELTKHEFLLLYYFMDNPNIILSREDLMNHLYPNLEKDILDRTIDAHIKKLRKKIEDDAKNPKRIVTVRGLGYKYVQGN